MVYTTKKSFPAIAYHLRDSLSNKYGRLYVLAGRDLGHVNVASDHVCRT